MSGKRYFVDKHNADTVSGKHQSMQVGGGSKTTAKANALKARMRAIDAARGGSNWYTTREGSK
jgi:hypothetical protein